MKKINFLIFCDTYDDDIMFVECYHDMYYKLECLINKKEVKDINKDLGDVIIEKIRSNDYILHTNEKVDAFVQFIKYPNTKTYILVKNKYELVKNNYEYINKIL